MHDAMKRLEIQVLLKSGLPVTEVAGLSEVGERTVFRVREEAPIVNVSESDAERSQRMGRPSAMKSFEPKIRAWIEAEPSIRTIAILERLREDGYAGGKSSVFEAVKRLRPERSKEAIVRFEAVPGEFSQHDFGEVNVRYEDGSTERLQFFASRLKYCRRCRVFLVPNQKVESVCEGLLDAFTFFGGVTLIAVFDNPKTIVASRDGKHVKWNETFGQFCAEAQIVPRATWPYRPQEKGSVENLVGFAQTSFFKVHVFKNRRDLEEKLAAWHTRVNEERPCRATGEIPAVRYLVEKERLRPLGIDPQSHRLRFSRIVRTDAFIEFESKRYYVGEQFIGQTVTLRVGRNDIEVHAALERVCVHPKHSGNPRSSVLQEQRSELLKKPGARPYVKRQFLMDLCPAAEWLITELRHRRPQSWEADIDQMFALFEEHGEDRMRAVLIEAARRETVGAEYVEAILLGQVDEQVIS